MSTIPASALVNVIPNVLGAGGNAIDMLGVMLTTNPRIPVGTPLEFASPINVSSYFGPSSVEYAQAQVYFNGYETRTATPAGLWIAQYNPTAVPAYVRGGPITGYTLTQLANLSGSLTVVIDGYVFTAASLSLTGATSYSSAAALIQASLIGNDPTEASVTGSIASATASFTGSIQTNTLTVTSMTSGALQPGAILGGAGITAGTQVQEQLTGTTGGVGTYLISASQNVASEAITGTYGVMTVSAVSSGTISVDQTITGAGITAGTQVYALGTGQGLNGTYIVTPAQTVASGALTAKASTPTVSFDPISGGLVITSGYVGPASSLAFATGTLASQLMLTQQMGAVLSQGALPATPAAFMNGIIGYTQNWATFFHIFDPDMGFGNTQKLAFATWANNQNKRYGYIASDTDITPTLSTQATTSLGYIVNTTDDFDGTFPLYDPMYNKAAFVSGTAASIDFTAKNGRITFAFRSQPGLVADVTNQTVASNLDTNGYNFYGVYANAKNRWIILYPGSVTGEFLWFDSYINQIWLNYELQTSIMSLLTTVNSIPYTAAGNALIEAACQDPIQAALNFGAIRTGVTLSYEQAAEINSAAGTTIANTLMAQGYYLLIQAASPQTRSARSSPPISLWYLDGQSVQQIVLNSIEVQ